MILCLCLCLCLIFVLGLFLSFVFVFVFVFKSLFFSKLEKIGPQVGHAAAMAQFFSTVMFAGVSGGEWLVDQLDF